ncbi:MAG TPA: hypothetical protein VK208_19570 [Pyrinomonadaceae bacterium]|jgi:hypothetical protein|nr:hypothetical protein [Pyrinomonadaceae bacterium]
MIKRILLSMLVSLVVVVCVAASPQRQETFMIYHGDPGGTLAVRGAIVTVCWDDVCQTKVTTNIGHAKFLVPIEVTSVFVDVVPEDPDMCPFSGMVTLTGMKEYQYIWLSDFIPEELP